LCLLGLGFDWRPFPLLLANWRFAQTPSLFELGQTWIRQHSQSSEEPLLQFVLDLTGNMANVVELMLCLIRGSDQAGHPSRPLSSAKQQPLADLHLRANNLGAPFAAEQTYLSLATFSMFRLAIDNGIKAGVSSSELEAQVADIVRQIPPVMLYRAMDVQYAHWLAREKVKGSKQGASA